LYCLLYVMLLTLSFVVSSSLGTTMLVANAHRDPNLTPSQSRALSIAAGHATALVLADDAERERK
jgi:hypothetical protein